MREVVQHNVGAEPGWYKKSIDVIVDAVNAKDAMNQATKMYREKVAVKATKRSGTPYNPKKHYYSVRMKPRTRFLKNKR